MWIIVAVFLLASGGVAHAGHSAEHDYLRSWIATSCCVASDCCYRIAPKEIEPVGDDRWRVKASGQVVKRTEWSPDGRTYQCACRLEGGTYVQDSKAHTYCLFPPMQAVDSWR